MTNRMTSELQAGHRHAATRVAAQAGRDRRPNPQALMDADDRSRHSRAQLAPLGAAGATQVAAQVSTILRRGRPPAGVTEMFLLGAGLMALAFVASFFLREIPLRTTHETLDTAATPEAAVPETPGS